MTDEAETNERIDALVATVLAVHGGRLDAEQRDILRQHVERLRQSAEALDGYPLTNADEPDFAFGAVQGMDAA